MGARRKQWVGGRAGGGRKRGRVLAAFLSVGARSFVIFGLAAACLSPRQAEAEEWWQNIHADFPSVVSETTYEREHEERTTNFTNSVERTDTLATRYDIRTRGWVYDPALAVYSVQLRPMIKKQRTKAAGNFKRDDQLLFFGYTFDTTILQFKPYSLQLFSSRDRSQFDTSLSPDSITQTAIDRGTLRLDYWNVPTDITFERREIDFEGFNEFQDTTLLGRVQSRHRTDRSRSRVKTEIRRQTRERERSTVTVDRVQLNGTNSYKFSDDVRLSSSVLGNITASEEFSSKTATLSEALFLRHTPNLNTEYQLRYDGRDENDFASNTLFGSTRLTHQLFENLTTTLTNEVEDEIFTGGEIRTFESDLDFRYRRSIPWGWVGVTNGYRYRLEDNNTDPVLTDVRDETHVLAGVSLSFLENINVDANSIVVTDTTGLIIYVLNTDYIVTLVGDTIGIQRTGIGSAIADGQTVLIDYQFTPQAPFLISNVGLRAGVSLGLWNMIRLSYNFTRSKDTLLSGTRPFTLEDDVTHRARGEFRWRWSTTQADYELRDTTRTPLTRWSVREALSFRPFRRLSFGVGASYSETELTDTGDVTTAVGGNASLQWRVARWGEIDVNAFTRRLRGDIQETDNTGIVSRFRWRWGQWSGSVRYEFVKDRDFVNNQSRDRQAIMFQLVRKWF